MQQTLKHAECCHSSSGGNNYVNCKHGNQWNTYGTRLCLCGVLSAKWMVKTFAQEPHRNELTSMLEEWTILALSRLSKEAMDARPLVFISWFSPSEW